MAGAKNFASVKLPESLVQLARDAAQPLRRSAAGQIEYWVTLGRVVEHSGLTVQEAREAIEGYEAAAHEASQASRALQARVKPAAEHTDLLADAMVDSRDTLESLKRRGIAVSEDGALGVRIRTIVAQNRRKVE